MSNKQNVGGYILVDFGGVDFTSESPVILAGIHGRIAAAIKSGKAIVAVGLRNDGAVVSPFIPIVSNGENDAFIAATVGYTLTISAMDGVSVEAGGDTPSGDDGVVILDFGGVVPNDLDGKTVDGILEVTASAIESGKPIFVTNVLGWESPAPIYFDYFLPESGGTFKVIGGSGAISSEELVTISAS